MLRQLTTRRVDAASQPMVGGLQLRCRPLGGIWCSLDDAWRTLKFLETEDARFDVEGERRAVEETLEKLRSVGPTIQRLKDIPEPH